MALFSGCPLFPLALTLFLHSLLWGSLSSERRDLMETSIQGFQFPGFSISVSFLTVDICVFPQSVEAGSFYHGSLTRNSFIIIQEYHWESVYTTYFFSFGPVLFLVFPESSRAIQSQVLHYPNSVGCVRPTTEWALSQISYWLVTPTCLFMLHALLIHRYITYTHTVS